MTNEEIKQLILSFLDKRIWKIQNYDTPKGNNVPILQVLKVAKETGIQPSDKLVKAIEDFIESYPEYSPYKQYIIFKPKTIGSIWIVAAYFFLKGKITSIPFNDYLIISLYFNGKGVKFLHHRGMIIDEIMYDLVEVGVYKLIFEEAQEKLLYLDISPVYDGNYQSILEDENYKRYREKIY